MRGTFCASRLQRCPRSALPAAFRASLALARAQRLCVTLACGASTRAGATRHPSVVQVEAKLLSVFHTEQQAVQAWVVLR